MTMDQIAERLRPRNVTTRRAEKRWDDRREFFGLYAREPIPAGDIVWVSYLYPEDCDLFHWSDLRERPDLVKYAYQIGSDLFSHSRVIEADPSNYLNHSCAPNTWYDDDRTLRMRYVVESLLSSNGRMQDVAAYLDAKNGAPPQGLELLRDVRAMVEKFLIDDEIEFLVASRDIAVDEEITMDYSTFWTISDLEFECRCNSARCRKHLRKSDWEAHPREHCALHVRRN
jgi:hypothetical protein